MLLVGHGNALRALNAHLEQLGEQQVQGLVLPTGVPRSYSWQAWPVAALATVGGVLVVLGLALPSTFALVAGFYLTPCSFLGLWIPLRRGAHLDRASPCGRNPGMVPGHHHRPPRRFPGRPGSAST